MKRTTYILFTIVAALTACQPEKPQATEEANVINANTVALTSEQIRNGNIVTGTPERKILRNEIRVTGSIEAPPGNIISVSFPYGGYIKKMDLLPGTKVSRGQLLATLEDPQYIQLQQDYLLAKSKHTLLQTQFERQQTLNTDKTISDKSFQQAQEEFDSQTITLKALGEKLRMINVNPDKLSAATISGEVRIYSPINGYVTEIFVNTGKYVNPTDVLFELVNPEDVHLILNVYEKDINSIRVGQMVTCYASDNPSKKYMAKVHLVSKSIRADRTSEVHCDFDDQQALSVLPGMFVTADVSLVTSEVIAIPDDAVVTWGNKTYVFMPTADSVFEMKPVETGLRSEGYTEVRSINTGQHVVVKNAYTLLMKLKSSEED
jgi:membrane fusion protein, heavy metal efflux system